MILRLIRGLPGSGKSTKAKQLEKKGFAHFEADQFFEGENGYNFNPALLPEAHEQCQRKTRKALENGVDVVVSNTFCQQWEIEPYRKIASKTGSKLEIETTEGKFKNVHGVPDHVIKAMRNRWED